MDCAGATAPGYAYCNSEILVSAFTGVLVQPNAYAGYGPDDLQSAYGLTSSAATRGADQTVVIVDVYDDFNVESDFVVYCFEYGFFVCTIVNGCFRKVNQSNDTTPPTT